MLKFIIISLISLLFVSLNYYSNIKNNGIGLVFKDKLIPLVLNDEFIEIEKNTTNFKLENKFKIASRTAFTFKQLNSFNADIVSKQIIQFKIMNDASYRYFDLVVDVKDKTKEIVEVYIDKPIYIYQENNQVNELSQDANVSGIKDLTIKANTDFEEFLELISKDIKSNMNVMIDYTKVNLSCPGTYPIYYHLGEKIISANITIV